MSHADPTAGVEPGASGPVGRVRNVRTSYTFQGKTQSISAWAREFRISRSVLKYRLQHAGWPIDKALTLPITHPTLANIVSKDFKPGHARRDHPAFSGGQPEAPIDTAPAVVAT